jgi:pyrimidine operon attenuation protein/uracil phosphoribosyltransferase
MHEASSPREDAASARGAATVVLRERDVRRALTRIAHEIAERNAGECELSIVGIHRRGAFLARRLRDAVSGLLDCEIPLGDLDIGFYRDDVASRPDSPILHASHIDFDVTGRTVVVVDDVLYTGRTVRAAIEALFDYGRPQRVQLAVLVDRGHRELPLRPDYVGKNLPTSTSEHVHVRVVELDGRDEVAIAAAAEARV